MTLIIGVRVTRPFDPYLGVPAMNARKAQPMAQAAIV